MSAPTVPVRDRLRWSLSQVAPVDPIAYSIEEAAEKLGVSSKHVQRLIRRRELPAKKAGRRVLIMVRDLYTYLEKLPPA